MSTNEAYRLAYEADFAFLLAARKLVRGKAQDEWDRRVKAEMKKRRLKKGQGLPDDFLEALRAELLATSDYGRLDRALEDARKARIARLDALADGVIFEADPSLMWLVRHSSSYFYSTQTQPCLYARGELAPLEYRLQSLGFSAHVRSHRKPYSTDYELWANAPQWMADAAQRTLTLGGILTAYNRVGVNARAYLPFLPYSIEQYSREYGWPA